MQLNVQKRMAADILDCSRYSIRLDENRLEEIKEAITKADIRVLIKQGAIYRLPKKGTSRVRARVKAEQRTKGRQKGQGSRKGKKTTRTPKKETWMNKIRLQRKFLNELKDKEIIDKKVFRSLYNKSTGGFFRSKRHIKLYMEEHNLTKR